MDGDGIVTTELRAVGGLGLTGIYFILFRKYVGRSAPLFVLSLAVAWVFLLLSPLYEPYAAILEPGRWILIGAVAVVSAGAAAWAGRKISLGVSVILTALTVGFLFVTAVWSIDPSLTIDRAGAVSFLWAAVASVIWYVGHAQEDLERALKAVVLPLTLLFWVLVPVYGFDLSYVERGVWRTPGPMVNPNGIAGVSVLLALPSFYLWRQGGSGRPLWLVAWVTFGGMVLMSGTRGALGGLVLAAMFYMVARLRSRAVGSLFALAVLLSGYLLPEALGVQDSLEPYLRSEDLATASGRFEAWDAALGLLADPRAWFGYGFGTEDQLFALFGIVFLIHQGSYVHNSYLGLTLQIGVVAATVVILWMFGVALRAASIGLRRRDPMLLALEGSLLAGLVLAMTESWFYSAGNALALPFWVLFSLLLRRLGHAAGPAAPAPATQ